MKSARFAVIAMFSGAAAFLPIPTSAVAGFDAKRVEESVRAYCPKCTDEEVEKALKGLRDISKMVEELEKALPPEGACPAGELEELNPLI